MLISRQEGIVGLLSLLLLTPLMAAAQEPRAVRAEPFSALAIYPELSAPAQVLSLNDSRIDASITAIVEQIHVRVGDVVAAGAELMRLECADQRNAREQSMARRDALKARLDFASFQYARARSLIKSKSLSDEQLRQRKADAGALQAELAGSEAGVERARRDVARCQITTPFPAVVVERLIGVGEKAQPGKPLLRLLDLSALEVSAQVQAFDAASLQGAEGLALLVDDKRYPLMLRSTMPALDPLSRSRELRLEFVDNSAAPGSSGRLLWRQPRAHLPAEYIVRRDGQQGVYVAHQGKAQFVVIEGASEGSPAAPNLADDSLIITEGRYGLNDGDPLSVVE